MKKTETKKEIDNEVLDINRVERMTAGGRRLRFRTLVVVGDKKGKVGIGLAKGADVQQAIEKGVKKAQRNMVTVPINEEGTILHEIKAKYGAATVLLKPQTKGRGLVAGGTVRTICSLAGIENISGKIVGNTRSKLNNAKATMIALQSIKEEEEEEKDKKKEEKKEGEEKDKVSQQSKDTKEKKTETKTKSKKKEGDTKS